MSLSPISEQAAGAASGVAGSGRTDPTRLILAVLLVVALGFYLVSVVHFGRLPLRIEEGEWAHMAAAVFDHGKPVISAGETNRIRFTPDLWIDQGSLVGAWHPPFYIYSLAAAMPFVGSDASYSLRTVGVAGFLLAGMLMFLIAREVAPARWLPIGAAAAVLLLVHPYAIQGSTFLDIDTTVYAPAILLVLWLAIRATGVRAGTRGSVIAVGAALALVLWMKMTTAIALVGVLGVYWLLARGLRRGSVELAGVLVTAAALFLTTFALWCSVADVPFSYTFDVTFAEKSGRLGDWALVDQAIRWHVAWFMPVFLILTALYGIDLVRHLVATRRLRPMDLPWMFGVAVLMLYAVLSPTSGFYQGKYAFPALFALALPIAWLLLRDPLPAKSWRGVLVAAAVGVVAGLLMPDLLTGQHWSLALPREKLAIAAATAGALWLGWRATGGPALRFGVLLVAVALLAAQSVRSYDADTSPMYPIPDTADFRAGAQAINDELGPREIAMVPKDLGFYVDGPVIEGEDTFLRGDTLTARVLRDVERVKLVATDTFGPPMGPETNAAVADCFQDVRSYGTVTLRLRTRTC
jgi:hypothetical protein